MMDGVGKGGKSGGPLGGLLGGLGLPNPMDMIKQLMALPMKLMGMLDPMKLLGGAGGAGGLLGGLGGAAKERNIS